MTTNQNEIIIPISVSALMTQLDGSALIGAFSGAVVYTVIASESNIWKRLIFMLGALVAGYFGAPLWNEQHTGFPAFVISSVIIIFVLLSHKVVNKLSIDDVKELIKASRWFK